MPLLFNNLTKQLESEIDNYLGSVSKAGLIFFEGIKSYLKKDMDKFNKDFGDVSKLESNADEIRRSIKHKLYTYMLIPDSRGDVLGLIETLDDVIDVCEIVLKQISIEEPNIPDFLKEDFYELAEFSQKAVEQLVKATKAFFRDINLVNDYVNKVHFYEHEADDEEEQLKRKIFGSDKITEFSHRIHLRYFAEKMALVSDVAEGVAERLEVYAIKRKI